MAPGAHASGFLLIESMPHASPICGNGLQTVPSKAQYESPAH
jgi:hypothetical protein